MKKAIDRGPISPFITSTGAHLVDGLSQVSIIHLQPKWNYDQFQQDNTLIQPKYQMFTPPCNGHVGP